jgi:hypothetical protein
MITPLYLRALPYGLSGLCLAFALLYQLALGSPGLVIWLVSLFSALMGLLAGYNVRDHLEEQWSQRERLLRSAVLPEPGRPKIDRWTFELICNLPEAAAYYGWPHGYTGGDNYYEVVDDSQVPEAS